MPCGVGGGKFWRRITKRCKASRWFTNRDKPERFDDVLNCEADLEKTHSGLTLLHAVFLRLNFSAAFWWETSQGMT